MVSVHTPQGWASAGLGELERSLSSLRGPQGLAPGCQDPVPPASHRGWLWVGAAFQFGGSGDLFPRVLAERPGQLAGVLPARDPAPWGPQHTSVLSRVRASKAM